MRVKERCAERRERRLGREGHQEGVKDKQVCWRKMRKENGGPWCLLGASSGTPGSSGTQHLSFSAHHCLKKHSVSGYEAFSHAEFLLRVKAPGRLGQEGLLYPVQRPNWA